MYSSNRQGRQYFSVLLILILSIGSMLSSTLQETERYTVEKSGDNPPLINGIPISISLPNLETSEAKSRFNLLKISWDKYYSSLLNGNEQVASKFTTSGKLEPSLKINTKHGGKIIMIVTVYKSDTVRALYSFTVQQGNNSEYRIYNCDVWSWTDKSEWKVSSMMYD